MLFIRKNKYILALVLGIVSMALIIPNITGAIKSIKYFAEIGEDITLQLLLLIENICIFASELIFVIIGVRRMMDKVLFLTALILYFASSGVYYVYEIFFQGEYSLIFNLMITILCIVAVFVSLSNRRYVLSSIILLLIDSLVYSYWTSNGGVSAKTSHFI